MVDDELDEPDLVGRERGVGEVAVEGLGGGLPVEADQGADEEAEAVGLLAGAGDVGLGAGAGLDEHLLQGAEVVGGELLVAAQPLQGEVVLVVA